MDDQKNLLLALVLAGVVLIGWQYFFAGPQLERQRQIAHRVQARLGVDDLGLDRCVGLWVGGEGRKGEGDREDEESRSTRIPIAGLGEEAFLIGGRGSVSLYVLTPGAYLRLSVGGPGEAAEWSRQAQALARAALGRL